MHAFTTITAGLLATASIVAAVDIEFARFGGEGCNDDLHIKKNTHLHDPHCKSFATDEAAFTSFTVHAEDDLEDLQQKQCGLTVYDSPDCQGGQESFINMENFLDKCQNLSKMQGKSVRVHCNDNVVSESTTSTPTPLTRFVSAPTVEHIIATPSSTSTTTVTMVEMPKYDRCEGCPGYNSNFNYQYTVTSTHTVMVAASASASDSASASV